MILLVYPKLTLALTANDKTEILKEEWKAAVEKPAVGDKNAIEPRAAKKPVVIEERLPEVFYKNITIRSSGISLRVILHEVAQAGEYNIIYSPGVDAEKITIVDIIDVPMWRALNTILFPLAYGYKITDKDLVILSEETALLQDISAAEYADFQ